MAPRVAFALTASLLTGSLLIGQERERSSTHPSGPNPHLGNQASIRAGMVLYRVRCGDCHGLDARGYRGPDLTAVLPGITDQRLFQTIRKGVPGTEMAASRASDDDLLTIIAYLRDLSGSAAAEEGPTGNVASGQRIFSAQCSLCHRAAGQGGRLGPDLSRIGIARSRAALVREIRTPSEWMPQGYETVTIITNDGQKIRGTKKNEDAFSIQVMDIHQRLQGHLKTTLQDVIYEKDSLMPAYGPGRLSDGDLTDLVGYLLTLREPLPTTEPPRH